MKTFDTVADLKLATLIEEQLVSTKGYYVAGDVGAAEYSISTPVAVDGFGDHLLADGNAALLINNVSINVAQYGADSTGVADASDSFQAAVDTYTDGSEGSIFVPRGTYNLVTNPTYLTRAIAWELKDGAIVNGLQANDTGVLNNSAITDAVKLNSNTTEMGQYLDVRMGATTGSSAYEKDGFLVIAQTDDDSSSFNRDCVGIGARGYIGSSNTFGRAWGLNAFGQIFAGGDGQLTGIEINITNGGSDNPNVETARAKYGLAITTKAGSNPGTSAILLGSASEWHTGIWAASTSFVDSTSLFIVLNNLFAIDAQGRIAIGTEDTQEQLHVFRSSGKSQVFIESDGAGGEASTRYTETGTRNWTTGLWLDTARYTITTADDLSSDQVLEIDDNGNFGFNGFSTGSGQGALFIANATAVPSSNPTGGGLLYTEGGALKYRGSSGTVTTIANA